MKQKACSVLYFLFLMKRKLLKICDFSFPKEEISLQVRTEFAHDCETIQEGCKYQSTNPKQTLQILICYFKHFCHERISLERYSRLCWTCTSKGHSDWYVVFFLSSCLETLFTKFSPAHVRGVCSNCY